MITIENVSFKYHNSENGALHDVSLSVREGEYSGRVSVCKMSVQNEEIYNISKKVGSVFQNPRSQFFCLDTTGEVAFGCENLGLGINEIRKRMKRAVSELEMGNLMDRDILLRNYQFAYEKEPVLAIDDMPLPQNEIVAITGQNGAGKSTFVRCLCGLEKKFKGKTIIGGRAYCSKEMLRKCYLVMQDVNHQLFCETVEDEVLLGSSNEEKDRKEKAQQIMEKLGIWEFRDRHPMSLSGGQKQRVAIASAILTGKDILIFDEPTSGQDHCHMEQTAELLRELRDIGKSIFVITHDRELIDRCCMSELYLGHNKAVLHMLLF